MRPGSEVRRFRLWPLTPVHVGSGSRLEPEEYLVEGENLVRLDLPQLLRALSPQGRKDWQQFVDQGRLKDAQGVLHKTWKALQTIKPGACTLFRTPIGETARADLREIIEQPEREGGVAALPRNPYTHDVVLPGSSVKGAIRTAIVSTRAQLLPLQMKQEIQGTEIRRRGSLLEQKALQYPSNRLEADPFRALQVEDVIWPKDGVRVDRLRLFHRGKEEFNEMQMHAERLVCSSEGIAPPAVTVTIRLEPLSEKHGVRHPLAWPELAKALNQFYLGRWRVEQANFKYAAYQAAALPPELGTSILLRLGRHSHFDSLSVDTFREGRNAVTKQPIAELGASRTFCELQNGKLATFGWCLLLPEDDATRPGVRIL